MTPKERARLAYGAGQVDKILRSLVQRGRDGRLVATERNRIAYVVALRVRDSILGAIGFDPKVPTVKLSVMTPKHPRWREFRDRLEGPEGCAFRKDASDKTVWRCDHTHKLATKILRAMGCDVPTSLSSFRERGGYCDCEVIFNVERRHAKSVRRRRPLARRR